jgi:hypothetical protein
MKKFEVTISRSATEYVIVHVEAADADAAEDAVNDALGQSRKVTLDEIVHPPALRWLRLESTATMKASGKRALQRRQHDRSRDHQAPR